MKSDEPTVEVTVESLMENLGIDEAQARFYLQKGKKSCCFEIAPDGTKRPV